MNINWTLKKTILIKNKQKYKKSYSFYIVFQKISETQSSNTTTSNKILSKIKTNN